MGGADTEGDIPPGDHLRELEDVLKAIAADFDRASTDDERRELGREQLSAIALQLQRAGVPGDALRPATAIIHGLIDVDRGGVPRILQTRRKAGGRPVPSDELSQRGLVAAAVTLFMRADEAQRGDGQKLDRAVRKVARRVERWRVAQGRRVAQSGRQSLFEAIKDWREGAMRGGPEPDGAAAVYASMLEFAADGSLPAEWAEWILTEGYKLYR